MSRVIDLTGNTYGRLTVVSFICVRKSNAYYLCRCTCGAEKVIRGSHLKNGNTTSCGCFNREQIVQVSTTHGENRTKLHGVWRSMKDRCYRPGNKFYSYYGGRPDNPITVCDEWLTNYEAFSTWAKSNGYINGLSLDRVNVDGNYEPVNCRFVTMKEQNKNKRNTIRTEVNGKTYVLSELAEELGIAYQTLRQRYNNGDRGEHLIRPVRK